MRVDFKDSFACRRKSSSHFVAKQNDNVSLADATNRDSFVNFSGKNAKMAKGFKKSTRLFMTALLLSAANHSPAQVKAHAPEIVKVMAQDTSKWWSKLTDQERTIVEKVENIIANRFIEKGKKNYLKDTASIIKELDVKGDNKEVVKKLLKEYEQADSSKMYFVDLKHLSPRKQELEKRALTEVINFTFDTGKMLRYTDENIKIVAENIGAKEEEVSFVKLFLKPRLDFYKGLPDDGTFSTSMLGDFPKAK